MGARRVSARICPKCGLVASTRGGNSHCIPCDGRIIDQTCHGCGAGYAGLMDSRGVWNNHQCDPKRVTLIEGVRSGVEGRKERERGEGQRLAEGYGLLGEDGDSEG